MTKYHYKFWEPNKEYEKMQAEVFNSANQFKFFPATADQIKSQFEKEKIDPKMVRYAFRDEEMVGYVQTKIREKSKELHISFPWVLPETPLEVQDKLFDNMLAYLKSEKDFQDYIIRLNAFANPESNLEVLKKRGFIPKNAWKSLYLDLSSVSKATYDAKFHSRVGTEEDIDAMVTLINQDGRYSSQFPDDESIKKYLKEKVFSVGHFVLVYENDSLVAAAAPLVLKPTENDEERIILRFTAFKDVKNQEAYIPLHIEIAKECLKTGYGKDSPLLVYTDEMETPRDHAKFIAHFTPVKSDTFMYYYYLE